MPKFGVLKIECTSMTRIEEQALLQFRGLMVKKVNENLPLGAQEIKDATFLNSGKGGATFVYTPNYALSEVSKADIIKFKSFLGECLRGATLDETTQNSSVPHTPGKHLRIQDRKHEDALKKSILNLKRFFGDKTL